ncbi:MAG: hypothetical protein V4449_00330 [Patescibacteria group bacterium]
MFCISDTVKGIEAPQSTLRRLIRAGVMRDPIVCNVTLKSGMFILIDVYRNANAKVLQVVDV